MIDDISVRVATEEDLKAVMDLAIQAAEENGFLNASVPRLLNEVWPALHQDNGL